MSIIEYTRRPKIYALISKIGKTRYVGSTVQDIESRFRQHRAQYRHYLKHGGSYLTSFNVVKHPDAMVMMLQDCKGSSPLQLRGLERHYIQKEKCVNKNLPTTIPTEHGVKAYAKVYSVINKEKKKINNNRNYARKVKQGKYVCPVCILSMNRANKYAHDNRSWKHRIKLVQSL